MRVFDASMKGYKSIIPNKKPRAEDKSTHEEPKPQINISLVNLDARFTKEELKNKEESRSETTYPIRPIPDGDFELILLGEDHYKGVKTGKDLPDLPKKHLVACLCHNADLFAWSAT